MSTSASRLARDLEAERALETPLVWLETVEEARAIRVLAHLASHRDLTFTTWSLLAAPGTDAPTAAADALTAARTTPGLHVLSDLPALWSDPWVARHLAQVATEAVAGTTVVLVGAPAQLPPVLRRHAAVLRLDRPDAEELLALLPESLRGDPPAQAMVRAARGLPLDRARRAFRRAFGAAAPGAEDADGLASIWVERVVEEKTEAFRASEALRCVPARDGLDALGGMDALKQWLAVRATAFGPEATEFGLPSPRGLLLLGMQGCGKSSAAKAIARFFRFPLLSLDLGAVLSTASEQGAAAAMRAALALAEQAAPAVLWMDELDKALTGESDPGAVRRALGTLLAWLSEKTAPVFVVATANEVASLPPELLRKGRFDEIFFVDLPTAAERRDILEVQLRRRGRAIAPLGDIAPVIASTENFSGAEIEQVVIDALFDAFHAGKKPLDTAVLRAAADRTVPLYRTYEASMKALRGWAQSRARPAAADRRLVDLFGPADGD